MNLHGLTRWLAFVFLVELWSGCTLSSAEEEWSTTVDVKPNAAVQVETQNGRIRVTEGLAGKVRIKAVKRARATSDPRKLLSLIKVKVEQKGLTLHVTAEHPPGSLTKQLGVSFELSVPKGTAVSAASRNGSIQLGYMHGTVKATTSNGSIRANHVSGELRAHTRNGSITVSAARSFDLYTRNGSVRVSLADGAKLAGKSRAESHNGSIRFNAPSDLAVQLNAQTENGSVTSDFTVRSIGRRHASGLIGAGGAHLELRTRNGSIRIKRR